MFKRSFFPFVLVAILLSAYFPLSAVAQDGGSATCDDGPDDVLNAAQAAYDAGDLTGALDLATQAESVCADSATRYIRARNLLSDIERDVARAEREAMIANAVPGYVNLGDYQVFMTCAGEGSPTVIFENGFGVPLNTWDDVFPTVAESTRVCRYDRLGIDLSDDIADGVIRTTQDQVDDLHTLLEIAEINPPYVFVGHSIGGFNMTLFTGLYPDEVVGLVYVDAAHPQQEARFNEIDPSQALAETPPIGVEHFDPQTSIEQLAQVGDFGDIPITVITAPFDGSEALQAVWMELHEDYASRSTNSQHIIAEGSGHFVQVDDPQLVIDSILGVLEQINSSDADQETEG